MNQFCEDPESSFLLYDLFSIVIHQGGAHGGHYHAYIRDLQDSNDSWYDFDDSHVSMISPTKISSQFGGSKESACTQPIFV